MNLTEIFGPAGNFFADAFAQIEIAEEVIHSYEDHPRFKRLNKCFMAFHSDILSAENSIPEWLYRNHCKELATRILNLPDKLTKEIIFKTMQPMTRAEVVETISMCSLVTPIIQRAHDVALYYFTEIAREENKDIPDDIKQSRPNDYELELVISECKNKQRAKRVYDILKPKKKQSKQVQTVLPL